VLAVIAYFLGQLIGAISHILYDRIIIRNIIGYPIQYMLLRQYKPNVIIRATYLLALATISLLIVLPGFFELYFRLLHTSYYQGLMNWIFPCHSLLDNNIWGYLLLEIAKFSFWSMLFFLLLIIMSRRARLFLRKRDNKVLQKIFNWVVKCSRLLGTRIEDDLLRPLRKITATNLKIDPEIARRFTLYMWKKNKLRVRRDSSDAYWMADVDLSHDEIASSKLMNWLNLYDYLRNYSCCFFLLSIIIACYHWFYQIFGADQIASLKGSRILFISITISAILFLRYWIIYYSYYSKYLVRAYVVRNDDLNAKELYVKKIRQGNIESDEIDGVTDDDKEDEMNDEDEGKKGE